MIGELYAPHGKQNVIQHVAFPPHPIPYEFHVRRAITGVELD